MVLLSRSFLFLQNLIPDSWIWSTAIEPGFRRADCPARSEKLSPQWVAHT